MECEGYGRLEWGRGWLSEALIPVLSGKFWRELRNPEV